MEFNTLCLILSIAAVVLCAVFFAAGILYRKKVAEKQIGSAEEEAKQTEPHCSVRLWRPISRVS